jgi:restriction system protein
MLQTQLHDFRSDPTVPLKMSEKSLFARLLRSPWWVSFIVAAIVSAAGFALMPERFKGAGALSGFPFLVIGLIAAWKQRNELSPTQIEAALQKLSALPSREFVDAVATAFERDGYKATRITQTGAELSLEKSGYTTLISCKRWKAANHGVEPLRELFAAMEKAETGRGIYIATHGVSDAAQQFAAKNGIRIILGAALAEFAP